MMSYTKSFRLTGSRRRRASLLGNPPRQRGINSARILRLRVGLSEAVRILKASMKRCPRLSVQRSHFVAVFLLPLSTLCIAAHAFAKDPFDVQRAANKVDQFILAHLKSKNLRPNRTITDEQFVRRTYLTIIGRIPTTSESAGFLNSSDAEKHSALIQKLLADDTAYTAHHFQFWADLLRVPPGQHWALVYREWIRQQIHANTPYDEFAKRLVSGHGLVFDDPAAAYYIRDTGMPLDNMSNTARIFLGTRLECAQCHDHPFDEWTQMDFFKMAAFTYDFDHRGGGVNRSKMLGALSIEEKEAYSAAIPIERFPRFRFDEQVDQFLSKDYGTKFLKNHNLTEAQFRKHVAAGRAAEKKLVEFNEPVRRNISQLGNHVTYTQVRHLDRPLKLPHDYQYSDANPHDVVLPGTIFGAEIPPQADQTARKNAYAEWLTSRENPRFTKVIVNRIWKRAFGHGIFEPVDDLSDTTEVEMPELLAYLEDLMREVDYDIRRFQSVLFHTVLFRREMHGKDHSMGVAFDFTGPMMRRMSAEQLWDSIATLVLPNIDTHTPNRAKLLRRIAETKAKHHSLELRRMDEVLERMKIAGARHREFKPEQEEYQERIVAAYDAGDNAKAERLTEELKRKTREIDEKNRETVFVDVKDGRAGSGEMMMSMVANDPASDTVETMDFIKAAKPRQPPKDVDESERKRWLKHEHDQLKVFREVARQMTRAVDLESPARRGHFLRDFGQSDRDIIENASSHASVPQSLYLLNSPLAIAIHNRNSVLGLQLDAVQAPEEKIAVVYRAMLTREPTDRETARILTDYREHGDETLEDLVWALLNSRQFLFIQ